MPLGYTAEAAYAVGKIGYPSTLPEAIQMREQPSNRLPLYRFVFEGSFKA